jgi:ribonuclease D
MLPQGGLFFKPVNTPSERMLHNICQSPITTTEHLNVVCNHILSAPQKLIGLDTEFMRTKGLPWPDVCLIQLALDTHTTVLVDTLAPNIDLTRLWEVLSHPGIVKVLHAGEQDIDGILYASGRLITPIFDTQIAGMLCGMGYMPSYQKLAQELCGAHLSKELRRTNWYGRPIPANALAYARKDVAYLLAIYSQQSATLKRLGRTSWMAEEAQRHALPYADIATQIPDDLPFAGLPMPCRVLGTLAHITDGPGSSGLPSAPQAPVDMPRALRALIPRQLRIFLKEHHVDARAADHVCSTIARMQPSEPSEDARNAPLTEAQKHTLKLLRQHLASLSAATGLPPPFIATSRELYAIAHALPTSHQNVEDVLKACTPPMLQDALPATTPLLHNWRKNLFLVN